MQTASGSGGRVIFRLEDGRWKDGGGSGESRVTRSILPPALTKTLLFLLRSCFSRVRVSIHIPSQVLGGYIPSAFPGTVGGGAVL